MKIIPLKTLIELLNLKPIQVIHQEQEQLQILKKDLFFQELFFIKEVNICFNYCFYCYYNCFTYLIVKEEEGEMMMMMEEEEEDFFLHKIDLNDNYDKEVSININIRIV